MVEQQIIVQLWQGSQMSFEPYIPQLKGKNMLDGFSYNISERKSGYYTGQINFGGVMQDNLNMDDYKYVELYEDSKNKLIAIKLSNKKGKNTRALRRNGNRPFMTCTSWLYKARFEFGYPEKGKGSYEVLENGLIVLCPTKEVNQ